jgi:hypothetical protein
VSKEKHPNPEAFAKIVLTELAIVRGEAFATRLRLYQLMVRQNPSLSLEKMEAEDQVYIQAFVKRFLEMAIGKCSLSPAPKPLHTTD